MSAIAIRVDGLSKRYRRGLPTGQDRLTEAVSNLSRAALALPRRLWRRPEPDDGADGGSAAGRSDEFWALQDVSFEVQRGEVVGIIGRNGAGKSTLLKILSRITEPTRGRFGVRGRIGSLLEVGTGFHPELTGRENVFLNGTFLGMSRGEIARKFDEIAAFAEIDEFLDTPVKRYSSGMQVRLGFAVAAHLEPDVLIIDEALAVGDAAFQKKCMNKIETAARSGRTVLFVSHSHTSVANLCNGAVWIDKGCVRSVGDANRVVDEYLTSLIQNEKSEKKDLPNEPGNGDSVGNDSKQSPPTLPLHSATCPVQIRPSIGVLPIQGEFTGGMAEYFRPIVGLWTVGGGQYHVQSEPSEEAISTLCLREPNATRLELSVVMTAGSLSEERPSNCLILFDYIDESNFKFAGCFIRLGHWVVGKRTSYGWITLVTGACAPVADNDYHVTLTVDAPNVSFTIQGVEELSCRFAEWAGGGTGFGTRGSCAHFRGLRVRELPEKAHLI